MSNNFIAAPELEDQLLTPERTDVGIIHDIRIAVLSPEAWARAHERGAQQQHAFWQFDIEWLSFKRVAKETGEEIHEMWGSPTKSRVTRSVRQDDGSFAALVEDEVEAVRTGGLVAIPTAKSMKYDFLNDLPARPDDDAIRNLCKTPTQRLVAYMQRAGIRIVGTDGDGQPTFPEGVIGGIFEFVNKRDSFPRGGTNEVTGRFEWDESNPYQTYMRYPLRRLDTYDVPEDRPTVEVQTVWEETETVGAATLDTDKLSTALAIAGYNAEVLAGDAEAQASFLAEHIGDATECAVFGTAELNDAAADGRLTEFIEEVLS